MKEFVKLTLATMAGVALVGILCLLLGLFTLAGIAAAGSQTVQIEKNSVMILPLEGSFPEQSKTSLLGALYGDSYEVTGLDEIFQAIEKAEENENIKGIYLKVGAMGTSPATLQALHDRLLKFKESGKFIVAYGDTYTQGCYYLCSVADKLILNPSGSVEWLGLDASVSYYKELLDKIGVEMQVFKVGDYKSAVEPYLFNEMSDANREQMTEYIQSIWDHVTRDIAANRGLSVDSLNAYADRIITLAEASEYVRLGMVDTLMYRRDVESYLGQLMELKKDKEPHFVSVSDVAGLESKKSKSDNKIAVYYADGGIDDSDKESYDDIHGPQTCRDLRELAEDDDIKAVVIRVNSPGGSAFASEQIWYEIEQLKAKKPVAVSMGGYAASGGYYISSGADRIFAEATTLTGSIGIFGMVPNFQKLYEDKLGIHTYSVTTNRHSDLGNTTRAFDSEERAAMQGLIENGYELFVKRCAAGRKMTAEQIKAVAGGRVWTGEKALELGLVDELGHLEDAIAWAAQKADLKAYEREDYPLQEPFWQQILNMSDEPLRAKVRNELGEYYETLRFLRNIRQEDRIQARMPYELKFNL